MAISDVIFEEYAGAYLSAIAEIDYADLAALQDPPFGCLSNGGAGISYMLHRAGDARRARAWADAVVRDRRRISFQGLTGESDPSSFLSGRGGALVARARGPRDALRAARAFATLVRGAPRRRAELAEGLAGLLVGATLILRRVEDVGVRDAGGALQASLVRRLQRKERVGWEARDSAGFAHGWGGVLFALVAWSRASGRDVPAIAIDAIRAQVHAWDLAAIEPVMRASWCRGAAGAALLWSHAYERTGERAFLDAAARAAREAQDGINPAHRHLCCGAGGVAYALLALHRVDPEGGWRRRAREVGAIAIRSTTPLRRPNGLLWGHPGLVCLALDLVAGQAAGFPAIEA
jgi:hypothetical protein